MFFWQPNCGGLRTRRRVYCPVAIWFITGVFFLEGLRVRIATQTLKPLTLNSRVFYLVEFIEEAEKFEIQETRSVVLSYLFVSILSQACYTT